MIHIFNTISHGKDDIWMKGKKLAISIRVGKMSFLEIEMFVSIQNSYMGEKIRYI